jgi:SAM-dependent methyltransferase
MEWPPGFFDRTDMMPDRYFYAAPRLVTHIDEGAIAAVGALYEELGIDGDVLDLMSSWVSHFRQPPRRLTALGMNSTELDANPDARVWVVHDLNIDPVLPFADDSFDHAVCCVSVDYLTKPVEVFSDLARVVRPGGLFCCTFSNRCFPMKTIRGWLFSGDEEHCSIVASYFDLSGKWNPPVVQRRTSVSHRGDPLFAVWATAKGGVPAQDLPVHAAPDQHRSGPIA